MYVQRAWIVCWNLEVGVLLLNVAILALRLRVTFKHWALVGISLPILRKLTLVRVLFYLFFLASTMDPSLPT